MTTSFSDILDAHLSRYPLMQPQDVIKLCFQSEFGPEHMVTDESAVEKYILSEWHGIPSEAPAREPEDIGNGLVRFHLTNEFSPEEAAPLLAKLFCRTAKTHRGTREGLEARLCAAEEMLLTQGEEADHHSIKACFSEYRDMGCPAVHHSPLFREAYRPHYRLLRRDLACYFPLLLELERRGGIIAIDGDCGSGKTRLSEILEAVFDCNVFHMDDYYLPPAQRQPDWKAIPGGNMDFQRLKNQVLEPLSRGETVTTRSYCCQTGTFGPEQTLRPKAITVIEGSYSHHPELSGYYDRKIFLTCHKDIRLERLQRREGDYISMFHALWIPMEELYHKTFPPDPDTCIINTDRYFL